MDKIEKIPIPEDVKRVLDNVSHILIGLNYKETARDYKQAVEKLISLLEVEEPDKGLEKASYDAVCRIFGCDPMYFGNKAEITARECDYLFRAGVEWRDSQLPKLPDKSLEEAIMEYYGNIPDDKDKVDAARHFAEWGAEYLRDSTKIIDKSLEEAAEEYSEGIIGREDAFMCKAAFIAGAEWMKEQMLKDAVEGEVADFGENFIDIMDVYTKPLNLTKWGKVKLIIVKDDDTR